jgi:cytochrome P450
MPAPFAETRAAARSRWPLSLGRRPRGPVLFACNGGSGGYPGMGADLFAAEPAFRASLEATCSLTRERSGYDAIRAFTRGEPPPRKRAELTLLALIGLAQVALWRDAGVEPDVVAGLSLGEAVAAHTAGALSLEDTVTVICALSEQAVQDPSACRIFTIAATMGEAAWLTRTAPVRLDLVGTLSTGTAMVLADAADAEAARGHIAERHAILREQDSGRASHTPRPPSSRPRLHRLLADIRPRRPDRPLFLASAGRDVRSDARLDARHWSWLIDHRFLYGETIDGALALGCDVVVEIAAKAYTAPFVAETARRAGRRVTVVETARAGEPGTRTWARARRVVRPTPPSRRLPEPDPIEPGTLDFYLPEIHRRPWQVLEELRRQGPVHHLQASGMWLVLDDALIRDALTRTDEFSTRLFADDVDHALLGADPPEHGPVRRQVAALLAPGRIDPLGPLVREIADDVLTGLDGAAELDVVEGLAMPVVHRTVARLLEIDEEDVLRVGTEYPGGAYPSVPGAVAAYRELRRPPGVRDRLDLDDAARASLAELLWVAGTVTTVRHIGLAVYELGRRRELRDVVAGDEERMDAFLEEVLRLHPPEPFVKRVATRDARLGDVTIPERAFVVCAVAAVNRDPTRYPHPERLDLDRGAPAPHRSFGHGPHRCPGARLSRMLTAPTIAALLERMPDFEVLQPDAALRVIPDSLAHGLAELVIAPAVR